jgi:hypothetical protein
MVPAAMSMRPLLLALGLTASSIVVLGACSSTSSPTTSTSTDGGAGASDAGDTSCETTTAKSQALSQACCTGWGVDACGALLFCAAFDGRTQTTCYPEGSRLGGQSCAADSWCASHECAPNGKCRALGNETCDPTTGCATVNSVARGCTAAAKCQVCDANSTDPRCPAACKGQDAAWSSTPCMLCETSPCCTQLAACTSDEVCGPKANTLLSCSSSGFKSCLDVAFGGQLDAVSAALKQCFDTAAPSCTGACR